MINEPNNTLYFKNIDWKVKKPLLQRALYALGTRHGKVLEVIVLRRDGLRGQAWVVMDSVLSATACLQAEQGTHFFGKDMVIEYARSKTKHVASLKQRQGGVDESDGSDHDAGPENKRQKTDDYDHQETETEPAETVPSAPPSKYLIAMDLPSDCNQMMLSMLFRQYPGFQEVRMPREGMAVIEFEATASATVAMTALQNFQLTEVNKLKLDYGNE